MQYYVQTINIIDLISLLFLMVKTQKLIILNCREDQINLTKQSRFMKRLFYPSDPLTGFIIIILFACMLSCKQEKTSNNDALADYFTYGDSIESAGIWNGVDMRSGGDSGQIRISPCPAAEGVADGVLADVEPRVAAQFFDVLASAPIDIAENAARDGGRRRLRELRERVELLPETVAVDRYRIGTRGVGAHAAL